MSLYSVLNLAQGGLLAQQAGISVTSENINGVGLPGYSRRSAQLDAFLRTKGVAGGVHYAGTERAFDAITYRRLVGEVGLLGAADARATALAQTESIVAPGDGSIGQQIGDLFAAFEELIEAHLSQAVDLPVQELVDSTGGPLAVGSQPGVLSIDELVLDPGVGDHHRKLSSRQGDPVVVQGVAVQEENVLAQAEE